MFTMVIYTINWFMGAILYTNLKCVPGYIKVYSEIDLGLTVLKVLNLAFILKLLFLRRWDFQFIELWVHFHMF